MEVGRGAYRLFVRRPEGKNHLEDLGLEERIMLKWIFKTWNAEAWTGLIWPRTGIGGGRF
jgi:hypothetical protein